MKELIFQVKSVITIWNVYLSYDFKISDPEE